jgi:hypothetical protein
MLTQRQAEKLKKRYEKVGGKMDKEGEENKKII